MTSRLATRAYVDRQVKAAFDALTNAVVPLIAKHRQEQRALEAEAAKPRVRVPGIVRPI